jgi:hypothetical protein
VRVTPELTYQVTFNVKKRVMLYTGGFRFSRIGTVPPVPPLSLKGWLGGPHQNLNLEPRRYEHPALTIELWALSGFRHIFAED